MNIILGVLNSNGFQTILLTLVGCVSIWIYKKQKDDTVRNAAILVKLEIDTIEKSIENLKQKKDFEEIFQSTPIYQHLEWFKLRGLLISGIDIDQVNSINEFFSNAIFIEEARRSLKEIVYTNRIAKIEGIQSDISHILYQHTNKLYPYIDKSDDDSSDVRKIKISDIEEDLYIRQSLHHKIEKFTELYGGIYRDFIPKGGVDYLTKALDEYYKISNTPAYESIKTCIKSKRKSYKKIKNT